jgi:4-amino-4-deoxy-L-arabinose transferase-like glycosyltransferase
VHTNPNGELEQTRTRPWWREWQVAVLIVLVGVAYFIRADALPLRGEEPTRAQIAYEMVYRHDWLVPRVQGEPLRIRPPLQNWVNAACCIILGNWDVYTIRLPSVLATLLTTLLIYGYARIRLGRLGAFTAAAGFATMADMFKMGLYAETEPLFILFVSASLLLWHWGVLRHWPDWLAYAVGYACMALATLTKGIQAPPYFVGGIVVYLVLSRQWRRLFCWGHVAGIVIGAVILLAWIVPYGLVMGRPAAMEVWFGDLSVQNSRRVLDWDPGETAMHLVTYPLEVAAATLPWCLWLLPYVRGDFRRRLGDTRSMAIFLGVCSAVAWPTCWIPPGGLPRYFAPLFPCLAVLIGLAVERCVTAEAAATVRLAWWRFSTAMAGVIIAAALIVLVLSMGGARAHPALAPLTEPLPVALAYAILSAAVAAFVLYGRRAATPGHAQLSVLVVTVFLVATFAGLVMNVRVRRAVDSAAAVDELKAKLPPGQALVSLNGQVDALFSYLYRTPIVEPRRCAPFGNQPIDDVRYFCFMCPGDSRPPLPFAWEEVGVVNLDRNLSPVPERVIVVGRRLDEARNVPALPASANKQQR